MSRVAKNPVIVLAGVEVKFGTEVPDSDLPPLCISAEWIEQTRVQMPELPRKMAERFVADYGLPEYDAATLTQSPQMAAYFEQAAQKSGQPKLASNWIMGKIYWLLASLFLSYLNRRR